TALLRSGYFRPDWPETEGDDNRPQQAEALLRLIGEPRGRDTFLRATDHWADDPPQRLEDEQAEEPRWQRTQRLARQCRPFLGRFFAVWDRAPDRAPLAQHLTWLCRLADDLGLARSADARDAAALDRLRYDLADWAALDARSRPVPRAQFFRLLASLA